MKEVLLGELGGGVEEATIQRWFFEEGDTVSEGEDLVELTSENGLFTVQANAAGTLAEVYYDEGEAVQKGEVLCMIDDDEDADKDGEDE